MGSTCPPVGVIAKLSLPHAGAYGEHLLRLDGAARKLRFFNDVPDLHVLRHARTAVTCGRSVFGYFVEGEIRGACELMILDTDTGAAEGAFSVELPYRTLGVGSRLMAAMIEEARRQKITRIEFCCMKSNTAMQALAARFTDDLRMESETVLAVLSHEIREPQFA